MFEPSAPLSFCFIKDTPKKKCYRCGEPICKQQNFFLLFDWTLTTTTFVPCSICHSLQIGHFSVVRDSQLGRDQFVDIFWNNINPKQRHNFEKRSSSVSLGFPYDYGSVMHYPPYAFSINKRRTIRGKVTKHVFYNEAGASWSVISHCRK